MIDKKERQLEKITREFSKEHRERLRLSHLGKVSNNKGKHLNDQQKEKLRKANLGKKHSDESRKKRSEVMLKLISQGTISPGRNSPWSQRAIYQGTVFRSIWEAQFAMWLDQAGIKWQYEPRRFDLGGTTYQPDFYLLGYNKWIEIKGYSDFSKAIKFKELGNDIEILFKKELTELGVLSSRHMPMHADSAIVIIARKVNSTAGDNTMKTKKAAYKRHIITKKILKDDEYVQCPQCLVLRRRKYAHQSCYSCGYTGAPVEIEQQEKTARKRDTTNSDYLELAKLELQDKLPDAPESFQIKISLVRV